MVLALLWLSLLLVPEPSPPRAADSLHVRVAAADGVALGASLARDGFDVLVAGERAVELVVGYAELAALRQAGLRPEVVVRGRPWRELAAAGPAGGAATGVYPDLTAIEAELLAAEAAHPELCRLVDLTARYGTPPTAEGRHLLALKLSDQPELEQDEPAVLIVSAHHAREIVTPVLALQALRDLLAGYGNDPALTRLLDDCEVWIAPVWNPDGYAYVFDVDNLWRKNRQVFAQGVGADLNRNYPVGWGAACGGSSLPSSATYRGPVAASEAETQTMVAFAAEQRFARVLDYHSFASEVRYGYGCWSHPQDDYLRSVAVALSTDFGYGGDVASSCCMGGNVHLHSALHGSLALLAETHTEFQPSYASALAEAEQLTSGALAFLGAPLPVSGHVTDACSGAPLDATVEVVGLTFANGETNGSAGPFGRYHVHLAPGQWTLRWRAPGHKTRDVAVTVVAGQAVVQDVALVPSLGCWTDLGGGTAGSTGVPALLGGGNLLPGWPVQIHLQAAAPGSLALLLVSFQSTPTPFLGGTLHAFPFVGQALVQTNAAGLWLGALVWPAGLPPGLVVRYQIAISDPTVALYGAALSNGLASTSP